jgi:hypothetical protein
VFANSTANTFVNINIGLLQPNFNLNSLACRGDSFR